MPGPWWGEGLSSAPGMVHRYDKILVVPMKGGATSYQASSARSLFDCGTTETDNDDEGCECMRGWVLIEAQPDWPVMMPWPSRKGPLGSSQPVQVSTSADMRLNDSENPMET